MAWVFERSKATLGARLVLLAIAGHADREGCNSWASVKSLSEEALLSERQTRYALRELEKMGEIRKTGTSARRTHIYELPMMGADIAPSVSGEGAIHDSLRGQPTAPEPKTEPSKTSERERDPAFDALAEEAGFDLGALTRSAARSIGVALAEIVAAELERLSHLRTELRTRDDLAAEIHYRAERYRRLHADWQLTAPSLAKYWGTLGARPIRVDRPPTVTELRAAIPDDQYDPGEPVSEQYARLKREKASRQAAESAPDQAGGSEAGPPAAEGSGS
jgi:helix-turn-helix protein